MLRESEFTDNQQAEHEILAFLSGVPTESRQSIVDALHALIDAGASGISKSDWESAIDQVAGGGAAAVEAVVSGLPAWVHLEVGRYKFSEPEPDQRVSGFIQMGMALWDHCLAALRAADKELTVVEWANLCIGGRFSKDVVVMCIRNAIAVDRDGGPLPGVDVVSRDGPLGRWVVRAQREEKVKRTNKFPQSILRDILKGDQQ